MGFLLIVVQGNGQRELEFLGFFGKGVVRTDDKGVNLIIIYGNGEQNSRRILPHPLGVGGVEGEGSLAAPEVGDAHSRQEKAPGQLLRREGDGHPQDGAEHPLICQNIPEGLALPQQRYLWLAQGDEILPQRECSGRSADAGGGKVGKIGPGVAA